MCKSFKTKISFVLSFFILNSNLYANFADLARLQKAYPEYIQDISEDFITWADGTKMNTQDGKPNKTQQEKLDNPSLSDQINNITYELGIPPDPTHYSPMTDPGRIRYEPFFRKMYGNSEAEVEAKLVTIYWMPAQFGTTYPLLVTSVNHVDQKLIQISNELDILVSKHPEHLDYLQNPGGTFTWRYIANTNRLSAHSFGMTIDINPETTNYWQWDLENTGLPITEETPLIYQNSVPWEIIPIFEKYGFIWGGKWYHYDSMHFEYRPELNN
jgi:hypothetical protein